MNTNYDLIVRRSNGDQMGYVLQTPSVALSTSMYSTNQSTIEHLKQAPNVPMNVGMSTPTQAGGTYDVRDADGDKAITHLDWSLGEGQDSLDNDGSSASRYFSGRNIEISIPGQMTLSRKLDFNEVEDALGPIYAALGYYWLACDGGGVKYSQDGETWTAATLNDANVQPIMDWTTDGTSVYFCVAGGGSPGVWKSSLASPIEFDKVCSSALVAIEYNAGMLFAASTSGAGFIDPSTWVYSEDTEVFLADNVTIGLDSVNNAVYWTTSQGGSTFVYQLTYDISTAAVLTSEYTHFRSGFIGTCAHGYLDTLYVGGYLDELNSGIGQGRVYVCTQGSSFPLTSIGPSPGVHPELPDDELDHRVWALCSGGDKLYIQCSRGIYVWDISNSGYHHFTDLYSPGVGLASGSSPDDAFDGGAFQVTAFQTSATVYETIVHPGIAFGAGRLVCPYVADSDGTTGVAITSDDYQPVGELVTSVTSFHTGSMAKDFFVVTVSHNVLEAGEAIAVAYKIDNGDWKAAPLKSSSPVQSTFTVAEQGYSVTTKVSLTGPGTSTPNVRTVNQVWNFVPVSRHVYQLDCRQGASDGRWTENPEQAIAHISLAANEHAVFEDRFRGEYEGIIEKFDYQQASWSAKEGVSGLVQIQVREI